MRCAIFFDLFPFEPVTKYCDFSLLLPNNGRKPNFELFIKEVSFLRAYWRVELGRYVIRISKCNNPRLHNSLFYFLSRFIVFKDVNRFYANESMSQRKVHSGKIRFDVNGCIFMFNPWVCSFFDIQNLVINIDDVVSYYFSFYLAVVVIFIAFWEVQFDFPDF